LKIKREENVFMKTKNKMHLVITIISVILLTACSKDGKSDEANNDDITAIPTIAEKAPTIAPTKEPATPTPAVLIDEEQIHADMVGRSLVAVGNNQRFRVAVEKARNGENVTIAYLGGSITQGVGVPTPDKNFATLATKSFAEKYAKDKSKVTCINAGIAGTPSTLGIVRSEDDIISKNPDIVFVEFAVNDGQDADSREIYESLVKKLLNSESKPAVVLLFTVLRNGYAAQEHMSKIGAYYDLGMISVKDAIFPEINANRMVFLEDYAADDAHPNVNGNILITEFISNYFDAAYANAKDLSYAIPDQPLEKAGYATLKNVTTVSGLIINAGDFEEKPLSCFTYTKGWIRNSADPENKPMVMKLTFNKLIICFKQENKEDSLGSVDVLIDGEKAATLNGYDKNAWGNILTNIVYKTEEEAKEHTVTLKMAEGSEGKSFTLLGIGYAR
jgi:acyl-CoA thioesterase I